MKAALPLAERIATALVYRNNVNIKHIKRFKVVVEIDLHVGKFYFRNNKYSISVLTRLNQKLYKLGFVVEIRQIRYHWNQNAACDLFI